ncbi:EntF family bacteriocin induction factor [Holzapfeliella floricola]|nr:EntF family bacteriocin induction factor [Holzapfeliella floricola]
MKKLSDKKLFKIRGGSTGDFMRGRSKTDPLQCIFSLFTRC